MHPSRSATRPIPNGCSGPSEPLNTPSAITNPNAIGNPHKNAMRAGQETSCHHARGAGKDGVCSCCIIMDYTQVSDHSPFLFGYFSFVKTRSPPRRLMVIWSFAASNVKTAAPSI